VVRLSRFGAYEIDLRARELRKNGINLKLSGQPFQVLTILLEHPGGIVTREELRKRLWPDTFVDVEHNLNTAINKIREVLGDSSDNPPLCRDATSARLLIATLWLIFSTCGHFMICDHEACRNAFAESR